MGWANSGSLGRGKPFEGQKVLFVSVKKGRQPANGPDDVAARSKTNVAQLDKEHWADGDCGISSGGRVNGKQPGRVDIHGHRDTSASGM